MPRPPASAGGANLFHPEFARKTSMNDNVPADISAKFEAAYEWTKNNNFTVIKYPIDPGIHRLPDGGWQCNYLGEGYKGIRCSITLRPGCDTPVETHGSICCRWYYGEGGATGWLGHPTSPEEVYAADGNPDEDRISHFEYGDIIWNANKGETRIVNVKDQKRWYKFKHDQLLDLLRRAVEAVDVKRHNEALKAVDEKCKEDQFDVVLLGEFQYGKSTTLDTLCGGREMSPQGEGTTPTSAVPVSVQSLERGESDEWGEIRFKSKRELAAEIFDTFECELSDSESDHPLKRFLPEGDGLARNRFCDGFDIDDPGHLAAVRSSLEDAWERYNRDDRSKFEFSTRQRQLMEVTTLIVRFYGTDEYRTMLHMSHLGVDEIGAYVWFPSDWSQGASKGFGYEVSFEDARFAFVDAAILHLRSPFLEELGCRVTDCPGLDASAYDKEVTRRALLKADGVLFVHRCTKMVGASTLGELFEFVRDTGRTDKTILALNLWGISRNAAIVPGRDRRGRPTPSIVGASEQQIRNDGYAFPVVWCHILLAYLAALGERHLRTGASFTADERRWLAEKAAADDESQTDETLWLVAVAETNSRFKISELSGLVALDERAVSAVRQASNFDALIVAVSEAVLREKTVSILVDNGSRKALATLKEHETELRHKEEEAERSEKQCADEVAAAKMNLAEYEEAVKEVLKKSYFYTSKDREIEALSKTLTEEILSNQFFDAVSRKLARVVFQLNNERTGFSQRDFRRRFHDETGPLVADAYAERSIATLGKWAKSPDGRWRAFFDSVKDLNKELHELGSRHFSGKRLFKDVAIPEIDTSIQKDALASELADPITDYLNVVVEELREGFFSGLWSAFKWVVSLGGLLFGKSDKEIIRENTKAIRPDIEKSFLDRSIRSKLEAGVRPVFENVYSKLLNSLEGATNTYRAKIEARCDELVELHRKSDEELRRIAEENCQIREERIVPLRRRIEEFETEVRTTEAIKG